MSGPNTALDSATNSARMRATASTDAMSDPAIDAGHLDHFGPIHRAGCGDASDLVS
jgi:hypothetical protein